MADVIRTIGNGGFHADIAAFFAHAESQTPAASGNRYIGELIDQVYSVDAGTLAATIGAATNSTNYRWLRARIQTEVNTIVANSPAAGGGDFTITVDGFTTTPIAYNATAATIQTALRALPNVENADVTVAATLGANLGVSGAIVTITWAAAFASRDVDVTADFTNLSGNTHVFNTTTQGGGAYQPERHVGPRVYVRWSGTGDQDGIRIAENFFRMSGFAIICEDPQEVTAGNKRAVRVELDNIVLSNMYVRVGEGGSRAAGTTPTGPTFYCYYINGTGATPNTADAPIFLNCIAQGSRYFKGASFGFYFDSFARNGSLINCQAHEITRGAGGSSCVGFYTVPVQSGFKPIAVNCIASGGPFGFFGGFNFLVDPAVDSQSPLRFQVPYQCVDSSNSINPGTLDTAPAAARRANVDPRTFLGRPDIQDYRVRLASFVSRTGRDMSSVWSALGLSPQDFDGLGRQAPPTNAGGIGWSIGPYASFFEPFSSVAPTVEVKSIGSAGGRDYATIQAFLDATDDQSLPFVNKVIIGELYDDSDFSIGAARVIARRTIADVTHYRAIRPAAGHAFDPPSGAGVTITGTGGTLTGENNLVEIHEDFFRFLGPLLVDQTTSGAPDRTAVKVMGNGGRVDAIYGRFLAGTGPFNTVFKLRGSRMLVTNCIARGSNTAATGPFMGFQVADCEFTRLYCCDADRIKGSSGGRGFREGVNCKLPEFSSCIATDCTTGYSHQSTDELNTITAAATPPTGGTFTITVNGQTTSPAIPFGADAAAIQGALELLSNVAPGDVTVSPVAGSNLSQAGAVMQINWAGGAFDGQDVTISINTSGLTGGSPHVLATVVVGGVSLAAKIQSYCISSDSTAVGIGAQTSVTAASLYRDQANGDYRNLPTSPGLKRGGGAQLVTRFSTDFVGASRYTPFDCGAYEGMPVGPLFAPPQFQVSRAWMKLYEFYLRDGSLLLFSDQPQPVPYRGRTYLVGGFDESNVRGEAGMRERTFSATGPTSGTVTRNDLAAGRFRGAKLRTILLGKFSFTRPIEEQHYFIGDLEFDGDRWNTDFLSVMNLLENNAGRQATVGCPLKFGGEECGKDLTADTLDDVAVSSTIQNVRRSFNAETADVPASYLDDFFGKGEFVWLTGANARVTAQVKSYVASTRTFVLEEALPFDIVAGDTFQVKPGCRLRYLLDCVEKHANGPNFGGDPFMPGTDKALSTPVQ